MRDNVKTLQDYVDSCNQYAINIVSMDKDAPTMADINKICMWLGKEIHKDKEDCMIKICRKMSNEGISFQEAIRKIKEEK